MSQVASAAIDFTGGTVGGVATVLVGQPLDTVKVKLQTFPSLYRNTAHCFIHTLRTDGLFRGLYSGTVPSLAANVAENSVLFCAYGVCQTAVAKVAGKRTEDLNAQQNASAGFFAAFFSSMVLCPTELIKCKLQTHREIHSASTKPTMHTTPWAITSQIMKESGFRGLFRGLTSTIIREMPGYFFFFGGYEATRSLLAQQSHTSKDQIGFWKTMLAGGCGGICFWVTVFPADVVKSRIQVSTENVAFNKMLLRIFRQEGFLALYSGIVPTLIRTFPATGALFVTYEYTKHALSSVIGISSDNTV